MSLISEPRGASSGGPNLSTRLKGWLALHVEAMRFSLRQLLAHPVASLMTAAVVGIALSLPAGLHLLLDNAKAMTAGWDSGVQISLFLKGSVDEQRARSFASTLERNPAVAEVRFISKQQALEEFRKLSGFGEALEMLGDNPLPAVVVVRPSRDAQDPASAEALVAKLRSQPEVDVAQMDLEWVKRLSALMEIVSRGVWALASLLALAVLLIVGNTIRLAIENRRDEIIVIKLIGGTDGFIRRPFLYSGLWFGLSGALIAALVVALSLLLLRGPLSELTALYYSDFTPSGLGLGELLALFSAGIATGVGGAWLAVGRHLRDMEPT